MQIFGWTLASIGTFGLAVAVIFEWRTNEPIYILASKVCTGIMGIGGVILAVLALT